MLKAIRFQIALSSFPICLINCLDFFSSRRKLNRKGGNHTNVIAQLFGSLCLLIQNEDFKKPGVDLNLDILTYNLKF